MTLSDLNSSVTRHTLFAAIFLGLFSAALTAAESVEQALSADELELTAWLDAQEDEMLELLEQLTNINSGSLNKDGVDTIARLFSRELRELGFSTQSLPGDVIEMPTWPRSQYAL